MKKRRERTQNARRIRPRPKHEPPPGCRAYGTKAPRDIRLDFSAENIIYGTRTRGKKVLFAAAADEDLVEDADESEHGILLFVRQL